METIKYAETKLQQLKHACINCHPTMKGFYQDQYSQWKLHLETLKDKQ